MTKTVIGYFDQASEAQRVLQGLLDHGFDRSYISLIADQERSGLEAGGTWAPHVIAVPGVGMVLATGPLAARLSDTTGDPSGSSLLEVLEEHGVPTGEAEWYLNALRRGGVLLTVESGDADADRAVDIMNSTLQPARSTRTPADTGGLTSEKRERTAPATATAAAADRRFEEYESDFQRHHRTARPGSESYAEYMPAYRYGYALATEPRYTDRDWYSIKPEARRDWEARHQGTWDEFKAAVYYAWEHARGQRHANGAEVTRDPLE